MRAALLSLSDHGPRGADGGPPLIAGRPLVLHQLDFALAAGCTRIVAFGNGASAEAIALRQAAERRGARFQAIRQGRDLLGAVRAKDELLVVAPGLLPESREALLLAGEGTSILVLDADAGVPAGFERIDLTRAWAGVLVAPGGLVERLTDLPLDSDPAAALLRIACQARVAERRLGSDALAQGTWSLVSADGASPLPDREWVDRQLPVDARFALTGRAARFALRHLGVRLLAVRHSWLASLAAAVLLLVGGVALCAWAHPAAGFALLALAIVVAAFAGGLERLAQGAFAAPPGRLSWRFLHAPLVDLALTAASILAIPGDALHRLFPPLILAIAWHVRSIRPVTGPAVLLHDRAALALVFASAAALGILEPAIMLVALAVLLRQALPQSQKGS